MRALVHVVLGEIILRGGIDTVCTVCIKRVCIKRGGA